MTFNRRGIRLWVKRERGWLRGSVVEGVRWMYGNLV